MTAIYSASVMLWYRQTSRGLPPGENVENIGVPCQPLRDGLQSGGAIRDSRSVAATGRTSGGRFRSAGCAACSITDPCAEPDE